MSGNTTAEMAPISETAQTNESTSASTESGSVAPESFTPVNQTHTAFRPENASTQLEGIDSQETREERPDQKTLSTRYQVIGRITTTAGMTTEPDKRLTQPAVRPSPSTSSKLLLPTKVVGHDQNSGFSSAAQATIISISSVLAVVILLLLVWVFWRRRQRNSISFYRVEVSAKAVTEPVLATDHLLPDERIVDYYDYSNDHSPCQPRPAHCSASNIYPDRASCSRSRPNLLTKSCSQLPMVKAALMVELTTALQTRQSSQPRAAAV